MGVNYKKTTGSNLQGLWMKLLAQVVRCHPCCWLRSGSTNWKRFLAAWRWISSWGDGEATGGMIWPSKMVDFSDFPTKICENHEHVGKSPSKFGRSINFWGIRHEMIYSTKNGYAGTGQATRRGFQVPTGEFIRPTYRLVGIHQLQLVAGCNQGTSLHLPNMNMAWDAMGDPAIF